MYVALYSFFVEIAKKGTSTERIIADNEYAHLAQCCLTGTGAEFTHLSVVKDSAKLPICHLISCAPTSVTVNYVFLPDEAVVFQADGDCDVTVTEYSESFDLGDIDDIEGDSSESESELDPKLAKQPKQKFETSKAKQQKPIIEEPESYEKDLGGEGEAQYSHSGESSESDSLSECQYGE
ncbi:MAG: hypothetical protein EZS28_026653 [Streblomastix strix]|uniref:Nucleoplasmin-like domain-containing protein n=1 Tax=Streblomastix strix TaxID=222440 RepID=A0A5J4V671_9EUKA|nr:MAG: hypothetical protein EZS28_026653 [Streblomastix strix]